MLAKQSQAGDARIRFADLTSKANCDATWFKIATGPTPAGNRDV
jgi:hypothetical protein